VGGQVRLRARQLSDGAGVFDRGAKRSVGASRWSGVVSVLGGPGIPCRGRAWLEASLELPAAAATAAVRARALSHAAALAYLQGDYDVALPRQRDALEAYRELGDRKGIILELNSHAVSERARGNYAAARAWSEQVLQACRELRDNAAIAGALSNLGGIIFLLGHRGEARTRLQEASAMFAAIDDATGMAWCSNHLGDIALEEGEFEEARRLYEAGAAVFRSSGDRWGLARSACDLGHLACEELDYDSARKLFEDALLVFAKGGHKRGTASALEGLARLAVNQARPARALTLAGAAAALRHATGVVATSEQDRKLERTSHLASGQCAPEVAKQAWTTGSHMPIDQVIRYALTGQDAETAPPGSWPDQGAAAPRQSDPPESRRSGRVPQ